MTVDIILSSSFFFGRGGRVSSKKNLGLGGAGPGQKFSDEKEGLS